ncbi:succinate dehydrogenase assembly factor 4, mitochondrial [Nephila pilipes]|uniref:Succinate dehydrogenase assembly factor 4, mitochondrial n=1 Tax=Nephila pilipes TaxID=299642 RepID=A0A8X6MBQ3_NEPPI|nr:succinate dehydrogenase assembly factor 4, mitochondrial [Nephila pilipes]
MIYVLKNISSGKVAFRRFISLGTKALWIQYPSNYFSSTQTTLTDPKEIKRGKTPIGKLDQEFLEHCKEDPKSPFAPFPNCTNPVTGEVYGPTGPEPTRYGDWERKGRTSDF